MFNKLRIGSRLILLIVVQTALILVVGIIGLFGLNQAEQSTQRLARVTEETVLIEGLLDAVRGDLLGTAHAVNDGTITWGAGRERLKQAASRFSGRWDSLAAAAGSGEHSAIVKSLSPTRPGVDQAIAELGDLITQEDRVNLSLFVRNDLDHLVSPLVDGLRSVIEESRATSSEVFADTLQSNRKFLLIGAGVVVFGLIVSAILGVLIYRSISGPVKRLSDTVDQIAEGNYDRRAELSGSNELTDLGDALDDLLADKVTTMASAEAENEQLNISIAKLLEGVSRLSERDLTSTLTVSKDITGPVADAMNLMTEETSRVLTHVSEIAAQVESASNLVHQNAETVDYAEGEQRAEIENTVRSLEEASRALHKITELSRASSSAAESTRSVTNEAMQTVQRNLVGMNEIREAIQETGKRLKRLGERTNEITGIVDIINTIAERTNILALNASMQAASAGEAGRSFAVVAEEIQNLAGNARDATGQITSLVQNIQVDTNDTIATMDKTISHVVEGTRLAEAAGGQMTRTQQTTEDLVGSVQAIARETEQQSRAGDELRERASQMIKRTEATATQVDEQLSQTKNLAGYARDLVTSVRVFKLPG